MTEDALARQTVHQFCCGETHRGGAEEAVGGLLKEAESYLTATGQGRRFVAFSAAGDTRCTPLSVGFRVFQ